MTSSCSAKDDEKYLAKGSKRTITMLSFLNWAACRNNARFSWPVMWWCTNSQDASFDVSLMQRFWWCTNSVRRWSKNAMMHKFWAKESEMAQSWEKCRKAEKVHKECIVVLHHLRIISASSATVTARFETAQNCKLCGVWTSRHAVPFLSLTTWEKLLHVQFFNLKKNPEARQSTQRQRW